MKTTRHSALDCLVQPSSKPDKKFDVSVLGKTVSFGARGSSDFTLHGNPLRKERYLKRHFKNEDWENVLSAGFWSRWLLWNKPTLRESAKDLERRFNLKITFGRGRARPASRRSSGHRRRGVSS